MRVPGRVYADESLFAQAGHEEALQQVANVATLPGVVTASIAMPDIHWGYGFPIGGVAAMDERDGVVSPGGVGFDINCGVRLVRTGLGVEEVRPRLEALMQELMRRVPQGSGPHGALELGERDLGRLAEQGAPFLAQRGLATDHDLAHIEEGGVDGGRGHGGRQRQGRGPRPLAGRQPGLGQPLPRGAGGGRGAGRAGGEGLRRRPRPGHRDDPLRLARLRPPGVHRLPGAHGAGGGAGRHRAAGQAARLCAAGLGRRPASTWRPWPAPATSPSPTAR